MSKNTKIIIGVVIILGVCGFVAGFAILGMSGLYLASSSSEIILAIFYDHQRSYEQRGCDK